jgi:hypothetical protein
MRRGYAPAEHAAAEVRIVLVGKDDLDPMTAGQSYLMGECLSRLADERQLIEVQEHCAKRKKAGQAHNSSHACVVVAV